MTHNEMTALRKLSSNNFSGSIPTRTLNSLVNRGLVKKDGDYYHTITEKGAAVVYEYEMRHDCTGKDPYTTFGEWAAANGYDLDDDSQLWAAIEAYGDDSVEPPLRVAA